MWPGSPLTYAGVPGGRVGIVFGIFGYCVRRYEAATGSEVTEGIVPRARVDETRKVDVTVRRVRAEEGPVLKTVRLAALLESPSAFASTHEAEADQPDQHWASRASLGASGSHSATFLAVADESAVGIVAGYRPDPAGSSIELVSMWVAPLQRRGGIAAKLVDAVIGWANDSNATSVDLWVTRGNDAAVRLYQGVGFQPTGERKPLPSSPSVEELRMRRTLG